MVNLQNTEFKFDNRMYKQAKTSKVYKEVATDNEQVTNTDNSTINFTAVNKNRANAPLMNILSLDENHGNQKEVMVDNYQTHPMS